MPDPIQTREFLELAHAGDADAEWKLFSRFSGLLLEEAHRHRLMRFIGRTATADDVVSEVWLRAYSSGSIFEFEDRGRGSLKKFLYVLLDRTMHDLARRAGALKRKTLLRMRSLDDRGPGGERPSTQPLADERDPTPTSNARAAELDDLCRELLDKREWGIWRMARHDGLDSTEIAARLGMSAAAVRGVLLRVKKKLVKGLASRL